MTSLGDDIKQSEGLSGLKLPKSALFKSFQSRPLGNSIELGKQREDNKHIAQFVKEQIEDIRLNRNDRRWFAFFTCIILISQHSFVYWLIYSAFCHDSLKELSWFLGAILSATLLETYKVVQIIVTWLFKDRPYKPDCEN